LSKWGGSNLDLLLSLTKLEERGGVDKIAQNGQTGGRNFGLLLYLTKLEEGWGRLIKLIKMSKLGGGISVYYCF